MDPPPETYYRGKKKIDFYFGTNGVAHAVTCAGITSYDLKYSDHWALFVDINEELLFTSKGVDPTAQKGRGLQLKNKEAVKKYREVFRSKLLAHNIFQRCQALWETPTGANISSLQTSIEAIDSKITRAALQAERATATKSFGYAWSPTLADAGQCVTF